MASYPFKSINKARFQKPSSVVTEDALYWKKLGSPVLIKEFGAIDYLDFCPIEPYYFAVTSSIKVQIYNPITKLVKRNIPQFAKDAYGGTFRADGKLLVAGGEHPVVKLFNIQSKSLLRVFNGHTGPVHRTGFTKDQSKVLSFSDDKSVAVWDIAGEVKLSSYSEHNDYIRCGCGSPVSSDIVLSGGYDNVLKLYDCRSNQSVLTVNHGSPVETTLFLPSGGLFISGGGTEIKVWDIINGGKLLATISQHHKTVTCLRLASNNSRLLSASLDRHVKVYDISTFQVVHNIDFPNAILSLAISENDDTLVVGMVDGIISVRNREHLANETVTKKKVTYKYSTDRLPSTVDELIPEQAKNKASRYNSFLQQMKFSKALDVVMSKYITSKTPEITVSLIQELIRRDVLYNALAGRADQSIGVILRFLHKYISISRFSRTLIDAANAFIDIYSDQVQHFSDDNIRIFINLCECLNQEVNLGKELFKLEGAINLLLAGSSGNSSKDNFIDFSSMVPTTTADRECIVDIA